MRTSEEIYNRVRWDARFDASRFVVGVDVRAASPKRLALSAFVPGGDIPWHRVLFIEADGEVVWDRHAGVDRLDATEAGRVRFTPLLRPPFFTSRAPARWDAVQGLWVLGSVSPPAFTPGSPSSLRLLTWNTLWDRYDAERIDTARRRPLLVEALEQADADVIALQEVELPLLGLLLEARWVRAAYTLSDTPAGRDVDTCGVLLLSRLPVLEVGWHALAPYKEAVAMTVALASGPLVVVATHLSSNHSQDGAERRQAELSELAGGIAGIEGDLALLGDLNEGGPGPAATLGLRDAWLEARGPEDQTPTFDPTVNPLAKISSLSGRVARLDRVLLRGPGLRPLTAGLEGTVPVPPDGLYLSDHYGVTVELASGSGTAEGLDVPPTARTALAWLPPAELWPGIQAIRQIHDPQAERWPPHVNLVFGFVPETCFEAAAPLLAAVAAEAAPFQAVMEGVRAFTHSEDSTVWLDPAAADAAPWMALRQALARRFPRCQGREEGYTPHLTLGRVASPARVMAAWAAQLGRHEAQVGELVLLSRRAEEPLQVRAVLSLGSGELRWAAEPAIPAAMAEAPGRAARAEAIVVRLQAALPEGMVHLAGSRRVGCALAEGDLDLVAALPGPLDLGALEARVRAALPEASGLRQVQAVRVPGLELRVGNLEVDLSIVDAGGLPPAQAVQRRVELGEAAAMALSAVSDAEALLEAVGERRPAFLGLARVVKAWARARGLDSAPFGGLPGLAWLVLAARTVQEARVFGPTELLLHFFAAWAAWDWKEPVGLGAGTRPVGAPEDRMRIATPTAPVRSCSDQVGAAGLAVLVEELYSAWEAVESGARQGTDPVPGLLAPPPLHRRHAAWALIDVESAEPAGLAAALGWVRGRIRALLAALERAGAGELRAWPRPFEGGPARARFAVGLGRKPLDAAALEAIAEPWAAGLRGVEVSWAEGGAVPGLS